MPILRSQKYTAEEFFSVTPESNSERYELYDGEIVALAAPSELHQTIAGEVYAEFRNFVKQNKGKCKPVISPFDVKLDRYNVVQPDIMIICDPSKLDGKRCNGAPDLVVEITSNNGARDYTVKLELYKKFGVGEYWIIDPDNERVIVYTFGEKTDIEIYTFDRPVPVGIWDGRLEINIDSII